MKKFITTQTFDLSELIISLIHKLHQTCFGGKEGDKLSQQELLDYDFVSGQVAKIVLFILQLIYYLDLDKLDPLQTYLMIQGYYAFAVFVVLVEQKYIYKGKSYTYHRILAYRIMNIFVNLFSLSEMNQNSSLLYNWENIKKLNLGIAEILLIGLVFFTALEIIQLLLQLFTRVFPCMKSLDKTEYYDSPGGCGYLCCGQFTGIVLMGGSILLVIYQKKIPFSTYFTFEIIVKESFIGFEFLLSCVFYLRSDKIEGIPKSKKVLCFGYGFCIGAMGIISGPALLGVLINYGFYRLFCCYHEFQDELIICCWCAKDERDHMYQPSNIPNQMQSQPNTQNQMYEQQNTPNYMYQQPNMPNNMQQSSNTQNYLYQQSNMPNQMYQLSNTQNYMYQQSNMPNQMYQQQNTQNFMYQQSNMPYQMYQQPNMANQVYQQSNLLTHMYQQSNIPLQTNDDQAFELQQQ